MIDDFGPIHDDTVLEPLGDREIVCPKCQLVHNGALATCPNCAMWGAFLREARP